SSTKSKAACESQPACFNTCGPLKSGFRNCVCDAGMWSCATCAYLPDRDYSCFHLPATAAACPADPTDPTGAGLPQSGGQGALPAGSPWGPPTTPAYRDSSGLPKIGYCVCSAADGTGTLSCATATEWPPQSPIAPVGDRCPADVVDRAPCGRVVACYNTCGP